MAEQAQKSISEKIDYLHTQAVAKHKKGELTEAITFYLQSIAIDENQPAWIYGNVITLLAELGNFDEGLALEKKAEKLHPESDELCRAGGILHTNQDNIKRSTILYKKAIEINPEQPYWVYLALIEQLSQDNKFEEAIIIGQKAIELYSQNYEIYYSIAVVEKNLNNIDKAIDYLNQSISKNQNFFWSNRLLGILFLEQKQWQKAVCSLYKAINLNPHDTSLYDYLVKSLLEQGQGKQALAIYQKTLETKSQSFEKKQVFKTVNKSLRKRAKLLYNQIIQSQLYKITEEISIFSETVVLDNFKMYFWLADTLHSQNYWHESIECYKKCLQLKPKDSRVIARLEEIAEIADKANWINFEDKSIASQADLIDFYAGHQTIQALSSYKVDIIVCVHNALEDVRNCLSSILCHTTVDYNLMVVDDGSEIDTQKFVQRWVSQVETASLIRNPQARGYTKAANQGLRGSKNDYAILLNSDTIVTPRWIEKMVECANSDPEIGIVGPLSNCASWQSVPQLFNDNGDWMINSIPESYSLEEYAELVESLSEKEFPLVSFVNGFCYMIKKAVIERIGFLDEQSFPHGYGEENDFSLRAAKAGFKLAIADNTYVYHAKSKSFGHQRRKKLAKQGSTALKQKHPDADLTDLTTKIKNSKTLINLRFKLQDYLQGNKLPGNNNIAHAINI